MPDIMQQLRRDRNERLKGALSMTFLARLAGLILQGVSIPIAANSMGAGGFSIFAMLMATITWLMLANLGIAQSITVGVSHELGKDDSAAAGMYVRSARIWGIWLSGPISLAVMLIAISTPFFDQIFSNHLDPGSSITFGVCLVAFIFAIQLNVSIVEAAQLGHQEQRSFGVFTTFGTLASALAVYSASVWTSDPVVFLLSVHGPTLLARGLNAVIFLHKHPESKIPNLRLKKSAAKRLLVAGNPYFLSGSFNHFLCHIFPILIIGAFASSDYLANVTAVFYAIILASAPLNFLLTPFLGSAPEAFSRGDMSWVRKAYSVTMTMNIAFAAGVAICFFTFGERIFQIWYQGAVDPTVAMLTTAGIYLVLIGVEATNYTFLAASGRAKASSAFLSVKALISGVFVSLFAGVGAWQIQVMPFLLLIVPNIILSAVPLSLLIHRQLQVRDKASG